MSEIWTVDVAICTVQKYRTFIAKVLATSSNQARTELNMSLYGVMRPSIDSKMSAAVGAHLFGTRKLLYSTVYGLARREGL